MILFHIRIRVNYLFKDFLGNQRDKNEKRKRKKATFYSPTPTNILLVHIRGGKVCQNGCCVEPVET